MTEAIFSKAQSGTIHSPLKVIPNDEDMVQLDSDAEPYRRKTLVDVPWNDVVFPLIFVHLSWSDLFRLRRVSTELLAMVTDYFKSLTVVDLACVSQRFSTKAFDILVDSNTSIRVLNLAGCKWLSNDQLLPLILRSNGITFLDISNCFDVGNVCIQKLSMRCRNLETLRLKDCHWVNTWTVNSIAANCRRLEEVDLTSCWEISDEAAIGLITQCKNLKKISLSKIYGITDHVLFAMATHSKNLQSINVSGCWRITDYGIRMVGEYCHRLKHLVVGDCRDVSEESLAYLRSKKINVDIPLPPRARIDLNFGHFGALNLHV